MKKASLVLLFLIIANIIFAQVCSNKVLKESKRAELDSVAKDPYPYLLPIWGEKVIKIGYDIPYSAGLGVTYVTQESDILMSNLEVGFNNGELLDLDDFISFPSAVSRSTAVNIRPDFWLFPFLNLYGIMARLESSTEIIASLSLPNQDSLKMLPNLPPRQSLKLPL